MFVLGKLVKMVKGEWVEVEEGGDLEVSVSLLKKLYGMMKSG